MPPVEANRPSSRRLMDLVDRAIDILCRSDVAPARCEHLQKFRANSRERFLHVGVVGITSSGKSAFVNALMGESLIPEETRPTSNSLFYCGWGATPQLILTETDGSTQTMGEAEAASFADVIKAYATETGNPDNWKGIASLEWRSPRARIPRNLILVDTPGLDAVGLPLHEELTLRHFLPFADIVIYLMPAQLPMKVADVGLLSSIVQNDQRVLFVQSRVDQVKDDVQGGMLVRSREQKLTDYLHRLETEIRPYPGLEAFGVVQASSKLAQAAHGDADSPDWLASNFLTVSAYLDFFSAQIRNFLARRRGGYVLKLVEAAIRDLEAVLPGIAAASFEERAGELARSVEDLQHAHDTVQTLLLDAPQLWLYKLEPFMEAGTLSKKYAVYDNIYALRSLWREDLDALDALAKDLMKDVDGREAAIVAILDARRIYPKRKLPAARTVETIQPPNLENHVRIQLEKRKSASWFKSLASAGAHEYTAHEEADVQSFLRDAIDFLGQKAATLAGHVRWWEDYALEVYFAPLLQDLVMEKRAVAEFTTLGLEARRPDGQDSIQMNDLHGALQEFYALQKELQAYLDHYAKARQEIKRPVYP